MLRNCLIEIIRHKFGNDVTRHAERLFIVAGTNQHRPKSGTQSALNIERFISDKKRGASVYNDPLFQKVTDGQFNHPRCRFAEIGKTVVLGMRVLGMKGAVITTVKAGIFGRKQVIEIAVHLFDLLHRSYTPGIPA